MGTRKDRHKDQREEGTLMDLSFSDSIALFEKSIVLA
jgi:hypothetical protein